MKRLPPKPSKPTVAEIGGALPLTKLPTRGADPIACCNVCGQPSEFLGVWREHDERDRPNPGLDALVFLGRTDAHAKCFKRLQDHPRLYVEEMGDPGSFPQICGPCPHRRGLSCSHPKLKKNGGPGLLVTLDGLNIIVCTRRRCGTPLKSAVKCEGRS